MVLYIDSGSTKCPSILSTDHMSDDSVKGMVEISIVKREHLLFSILLGLVMVVNQSHHTKWNTGCRCRNGRLLNINRKVIF